MPLYEYQCKNCGHTFTEMKSIDTRSDPTQIPCSECNQNEVDILISACAIISPFCLGRLKPPTEFRERMKQIKESHKHSRFAKIKDY